MKIYISPSDQTENPYAWGNTNEGEQCNRIAKALEEAFLRVGGCQVKRNTTYSISNAIRESNAWGADYHICIHTNAFNGSVAGTRLFCWDSTGDGYQACKAVMGTLAPITPGTSDNITPRPGLNEVGGTVATTVYIEVGFHDNPTEAKWIVEHTTEIAEAICHGLCNHLGIQYKPAEQQQEPQNVLYRVQVGAFAVRANAEKMLEKVKAAGFPDAFITTVKK